MVKNVGDSTNLGPICSTPDKKIFISSDGGNKVYRSTDRGNTWSVKVTSAVSLNDIAFCDNYTGFGVGNLGTSIKTTDGGLHGLQLNRLLLTVP